MNKKNNNSSVGIVVEQFDGSIWQAEVPAEIFERLKDEGEDESNADIADYMLRFDNPGDRRHIFESFYNYSWDDFDWVKIKDPREDYLEMLRSKWWLENESLVPRFVELKKP